MCNVASWPQGNVLFQKWLHVHISFLDWQLQCADLCTLCLSLKQVSFDAVQHGTDLLWQGRGACTPDLKLNSCTLMFSAAI